MKRFRTPRSSPVGFVGRREEAPIGTLPIAWAVNRASAFGRIPRRATRAANASNSAGAIRPGRTGISHGSLWRLHTPWAPAATWMRADSTIPRTIVSRSPRTIRYAITGFPSRSIVTRPALRSRTRMMFAAMRA